MITTVSIVKPDIMLQSSFENHRKIFAHLKAAEKYLEATVLTTPKQIVRDDALNK
jgi:hypothetical protein